MRRIHGYVAGNYWSVLGIALFFFTLILVLAILFNDLTRYLDRSVPVATILYLQLLNVPKAISQALPTSTLFAASYALGLMHSHNELIAVFSSGISLSSFARPIIIAGFLSSVFLFLWDDQLAIPLYEQRLQLNSEVLGVAFNGNNPDAGLYEEENGVFIYSQFYNDQNETLNNLTVVQLSEDRATIERRLEGDFAQYDRDLGIWVIQRAREFSWRPDGTIASYFYESYDLDFILSTPSSFRLDDQTIEHLNFSEAQLWIDQRRVLNLPYQRALVDLSGRIPFAGAPFIMALIAIGLSGRNKKNILLMSLLYSLPGSIVFYIAHLIGINGAAAGVFDPSIGPWFGFFITFIAAILSLGTAKN